MRAMGSLGIWRSVADRVAPAPSICRSSPSCAVLATSRPSRVKMLQRAKPREPEALGLSMAHSSHSSTRTGR